MEQAIVSGIAHDTSEAKVTILEVPDQPGIAAAIFRPLAEAGVNVDMIVQNVSAAGRTDVSFTVPKDELRNVEPVLQQISERVGGHGVTTDVDVGKVSLVGAGMKTHPAVAADMFEALAAAGVNIQIISTSSIRISCLVRAADVARAVEAVQERFRLAEPPVLEEEYGQ